jgi:hypothetical protein
LVFFHLKEGNDNQEIDLLKEDLKLNKIDFLLTLKDPKSWCLKNINDNLNLIKFLNYIKFDNKLYDVYKNSKNILNLWCKGFLKKK